MNERAQRLAFSFYLRKGWVPRELTEIIHATSSLQAFIKYDPEQERVPAGSPDGGEWSPGGGDKHPGGSGQNKPSKQPKRLRKAPNKAAEKRAKAIYGETSGLTPQLINSQASPYSPANWQQDSQDKLAQARTYVGIVSERNPDVHSDYPSDPSNSIQSQAWGQAVDAAINGNDGSQLDPRVTNFYLRQEGVGRQAPSNWGALEPLISLGPFNNVGGGDVPKGPNTYIDFYGKP